MPVTKLSNEEATLKARSLPSWTLADGHLRRELKFPDFRAAMTFINKVADEAERHDHHPEMTVSYKRVTLDLTTHSVGGLSQRDFDLAAEIDALA